jgi:hypothetical protein
MTTWWTRQAPLKRAAVLFLIAFLAASAAAQVFIRKNVSLIKNNIQAKNLDIATGHAHDVDDFIARTEDILHALIEFQIHKDGTVEHILPDFKSIFSECQNLFLTDATGKIISSVPRTSDVDVSDRPYFREAMETGAPTVSDGIISRIDGQLIVVIALPIIANDGKPSGILAATVRLDQLPWLFSEVQSGRNGFVTILDSQGYPLLHANPEYVRKRPLFTPMAAVCMALSGQPAVGQEIPLEARIVTLCDSFDAMTTQCPYKPARSYPLAVRELRDCSGSHFDPALVEVFAAMVEKHPEKLGLLPLESAS